MKNKLYPFSKRYRMICSLIRWLRFKFRVTILPLSDLLFFVLFLPTLVFLTFLLSILSGRERMILFLLHFFHVQRVNEPWRSCWTGSSAIFFSPLFPFSPFFPSPLLLILHQHNKRRVKRRKALSPLSLFPSLTQRGRKTKVIQGNL